MRALRVYVDTSVVGGCLDRTFAEVSRALFARVRSGELILIVSELLTRELTEAPVEVKDILGAVPAQHIEEVLITTEAEALRNAYLAASVVGASASADALHVALATVARVDVIVSWNFRHIVQFDKIRGFNAVNLREGYPPLEIRSPRELVQ